MRLHRFFIESPIGADESGNKTIILTNEALLHQWKRVFRYKPGDRVILFDNSGFEYEAEIEYLEPKEARLIIQSGNNKSLPLTQVHLCASLTKKDTFEWMLEKVTELGVAKVTPILSERSEKKGLNFERAQRILIEASEQSGRVRLPELREIIELKEFVPTVAGNAIAFDPTGEPFSSALSQIDSSSSLTVFIGPEGGWSQTELDLFAANKIPVYSVGSQVLRAETASIAILSLLLLR